MGHSRGRFVGILFGFLMIPGSIVLLGWNEHRTIHRTYGLVEAERDVVTVEADRIASDHDGKLVHLSGQSRTDDVLTDDEFGVQENAVHLRRTVEMFQWVEHESGRDATKTYNYRKEWQEGRVESESFQGSQDYVNPVPLFGSKTMSADNVSVGAYRLNHRLRDQMQDWQDVTVSEALITETMPDKQDNFLVRDSVVYWSEERPHPESPQLGDLRIRFESVMPGSVSLVARLKGDSFETYKSSNSEPIERLYSGTLSVGEVFTRLKTENRSVAWAFRVGGTLICIAGVYLLFGPIQMLFSWVPLIGRITDSLFLAAALLIGTAISLVTISVSWIAVRPLLGIGLLAAAAVAIFYLSKLVTGSEPKPTMELETE